VGGAIYWSGPGLVLTHNVFIRNAAIGGNGIDNGVARGSGGTALGGAVRADTGIIEFNTFRANVASGGDGAASSIGNTAGGDGGLGEGGAVYGFFGTMVQFPDPIGNLFSGNVAQGGAGGAGSPPGAHGAGHYGAMYAQLSLGEHSLYQGNSPPQTQTAPTDIVEQDPLLHVPGVILRVRRTSPARGQVTLSGPESDLDGRERPSPATIGAYEPSEFTGDRTDLNRDRRSDILWRNSTTGQVFRHNMNGPGITGGGVVYVEPDTAWKIISDADFNGDGFADLLWHNSATGQVYMSLFGAGGGIAADGLVVTEPNLSWEIVATPDLDGDGRADLLWWNSSTGQARAMLMNGLAVLAQGMVHTEPNTAWRIEAVGEFSYTGKTNGLVWRNTSTGVVWLMTVTWTGTAFEQAGRAVYLEPNTDWRIVAAADLDGDGRSDLVWRNQATGMVYGMLMDGANPQAIIGQGVIHTEPNLAWKVVALGDYDGDGKADLLWRNESTGMVYMMLMNGLARSAEYIVYVEPNLAWKVLGPWEYSQ
jgi:hypothetical protein